MIPTVGAGSDFDGLLAYLQKPGHSLIAPLDTSVEEVVEQMKMVADLSTRCTKPVKHLTFSAAKEDGRLADETWLELIDEAERELGLEGHLRIIVRHTDKGYDHVHPFWCTVNVDTGQIPPKRWFQVNKNTDDIEEVSPRALTVQQAKRIPEKARQLKSYDAHALTRMQHLCRAFERRAGLRQLASPAASKRARENGSERPRNRKQQHRGRRIGSSLIDSAIEIRKALDAPTYNDRAEQLRKLGLGLRAATQRLKTGEERTRGILVYDLVNPPNAVPASQFDLPSRKFGLGALDTRTELHAPSFAEWIKTRSEPKPIPCQTATGNARDKYELQRAGHRAAEASKCHCRAEAKARHADERRKLRAKLMFDRKQIASTLPPADRRAVYAAFDDDVRAPALKALAARHRNETKKFQRARFPSFELWRRRSLLITHNLVFPSLDLIETHALPLSRIELLNTLPGLSSTKLKGLDRATPKIGLREKAESLTNAPVRYPLTLSCCRFRGHRDKVFLELEDGDATTKVQPRVQARGGEAGARAGRFDFAGRPRSGPARERATQVGARAAG